jgi:hypothetical protein
MRGSPDAMLSRDEFIGKFRRCADYALRPVNADRLDRVIARVLDLENVNDVSELTALLNGASPG